jgi:multidrug efflux pump subunit AcrB
MILFAGFFSAYTLNRETFPNVDFDWITVRYAYPGSSAEDVEQLVSIPVERQIRAVNGIEELHVMSGDSFTIVSLKVDANYDVDEVLIDVRNAVDTVADLPDEVEPPIVKKLQNKQRPLLKIALFGISEKSLRSHSKRLRDQLESINGVARVNLEGYRERSFYIEVDPAKLVEYELTLAEVANALRDRHISLSAGSIKTSDNDIVIRTKNQFEKVRDIESVVVTSNSLGNILTVKDIGKVMLSLKDVKRVDRVNGNEAIFLDIIGMETANIIKTTDQVKELAQKYVSAYDSGLKYEIVDEMAFLVKRRLSILSQNGILGSILVFICLAVFLNIKVALLTTSGALLAFMVAFGFMDIAGITINLISMLGLIMVLGMLVDDSIILSEQFYQNIEQGMEPKEASFQAAMATIAPVTATILTTIVAFGTLLFMGGIMGRFLWPVPAVVIICLVASWLECFLILPNHLADFGGKTKKIKESGQRWYQPLMNLYEKNLAFFLKFKYSTVIGFILLFFTAIYIAIPTNKLMKFELFPADDVTTMYLKIKGPVGSPFGQTYGELEKIEKIIFKNFKSNQIDKTRTIVGFQRNDQGISRTGNQYGQIAIYLTPQDQRKITPDEILGILSEKIKKVIDTKYDFSVGKQNQGPPRGKALKVEVMGDNLGEIFSISKSLKGFVSEQTGVLKSEMDYELGKKQLIVKVNEFEARRLGITNRAVAMELRRAVEGDTVAEIRRSDEDIDVIVRLNEKSRESLDFLNDLYILNNQGRRIKLTRVTDISEQPGSFIIRRFDRKRTIAITAEIDRKKTSPVVLNQKVKEYIAEIEQKHPDVQFAYRGENKDTQESVIRLGKAGLISMFLIFLILVTMFGSMVLPLIIMSSIPLALIGVVGIFFITGKPLGFMALMGVIGLIGVVVNDSIVLVNTINKRLRLGKETAYQAILNGSLTRFRPVILTTITTVAGLLPVAHAVGGDPFLKPMALSFAYGLFFSTSLTLVFIPCSFAIFQSLAERFNNKN